MMLFLLMLLLNDNAQAEYRVYQYLVRPSKELVQDVNPYLVTSALDPVSYTAYHGGESSLKVDLMRTWICPGHTGNYKEYCPSPYGSIVESEGFRQIEDRALRQ